VSDQNIREFFHGLELVGSLIFGGKNKILTKNLCA